MSSVLPNVFFRLALIFLLVNCSSQEAVLNKKNPFVKYSKLSVASYARKTKQPVVDVYFTGNVNGEIEPCGCAFNPKGGLDRRINFIDSSVKKSKFPHIVIDAGNALFPSKFMDSSQRNSLMAKADLILEASRKMGIEAQNVGQLDLSAGLDFLKTTAAKHKIKLISANLADANMKLLFPPSHVSKSGSIQYAFIGLSSAKANGVRQLDPLKSLKKELAKFSKEYLVFVLSDLGHDRDVELAESINRPMIFVGSRDFGSIEKPIHAGSSIFLRSRFQGQQWGSMRLSWQKKANYWLNAKLVKFYSNRWQQIQKDKLNIEQSAGADERKRELSELAESARELLKYEVPNASYKNVYEHKLIDLTSIYGYKNSFTKKMARVLNIKK